MDRSCTIMNPGEWLIRCSCGWQEGSFISRRQAVTAWELHACLPGSDWSSMGDTQEVEA